MIRVKGINKKYGEKIVLNNINQDFENGSLYALVGPNGIGKTTFMNIITDALKSDSGEVLIDNINQEQFNSKYNLFFVSDSKESFVNLTGIEYLSFILKIYKRVVSKSNKLSEKLIKDFKMENEMNKLIKDYSLGMKQKIYLIAAFLSDANNIILDETFNSLDPEMSHILRNTINKFVEEGKMIIYSTHNLDIVSNFSDRVIFLGKSHDFYEVENTNNFSELETIFFEKCIKK
ncbi:MAG: ABC transporter ATP-binding protein [Senegalia sp. (in: firmicutes)]|uniref:ABC transporter ATP-binding protein n=1 Tax=Bacillota TaxID=1239 RepID=UPI003F97B721